MENSRVYFVILNARQEVVFQQNPIVDSAKPLLQLPCGYLHEGENLEQASRRILDFCHIQATDIKLSCTTSSYDHVPFATILQATYVRSTQKNSIGAFLAIASIIESDSCDFGAFRLDEESRHYLRIYAKYTQQD